MKKPNINAATLKTIMRFVIVIIICLLVAGFYFAQESLNSFASEVGITVSKSVNKTSGSSNTNALKNEILNYKTSADKASNITFSSQDYKDKITQYLNKYASLNNISITNFSYTATAGTPIATGGSTSGLITNSLSITLANSVDFTNLMQFMKSIEINTPIMQITKINLIRNTDGTIKVEPITIEFYTR